MKASVDSVDWRPFCRSSIAARSQLDRRADSALSCPYRSRIAAGSQPNRSRIAALIAAGSQPTCMPARSPISKCQSELQLRG